MADRPIGRGRGRGRGIVAQPAAASLPPPSAPIPGQFDDLVEERSASLGTLQLSEQPSAPPRTAGRGRGRGIHVSAEPLSPSRSPVATPEDEKTSSPEPAPASPTQRLSPQEELAREPTPESEADKQEGSPVKKEDEQVATQFGGSSLIQSTPNSRSTKKEKVPEPPVIHRPGEKGQVVNLKTNYLRLRRKPGTKGMVQYHVTFQSDDMPVDTTWLRKKIFKGVAEARGWKVRCFDGMILYLPHILDEEVDVNETSFPDEPDKKVTVTVTFTEVREDRDSVVFFNILLHRAMKALKYQELRREFYDLDMIRDLSQHKLEIWPGKNLCAENQEDGLMIWVDSCSRVLQKETVYEYYKLVKNQGANWKEKFEDFILGKIVLTRYNNRCYRIDQVDWTLSPASSFVWRGNEITFKDYIMKQYDEKYTNIRFDMEQPMLVANVKPRKNSASDEKLIVALVPQLCYLTGLLENQKANYKVMADLATSTRLTPAQRMKNMEDFIDKLLGNQEAMQLFRDWDLKIDKNIIEVNGRVMDGPDLKFNARNVLKKAGPDFSRDSGQACWEPIEVRKFLVLCTQRDQPIAQRFLDTYKQICSPLGIRMLEVGAIEVLRGFQPHDFQAALQKCDPNKLQFVVVIMPMQRDDVYSAIKRHCVANRPIPSQCIVSKTLQNEKRLRSIVLKIGLQINCKLGGAIWALQMPLKEKVMFVGIDAAHDPKFKDPSVISLVATLSNDCTRYFSHAFISKVHQELGNSLVNMMKKALQNFYEMNQGYPQRIIVYRDGGSLGALDVINDHESKQLQEAVTQVCGDQVKNFTFVVVTKRIPQRFILEQRRNTYANPQPGTVIDVAVTRRHLYDFYIVSQQVREGTVNPTHFVVLNKDDEIRPDLIQRMTYATCFMYFNWPGTVRVPAVVQYAHKLCALLIRHVKAPPHAGICNTLYYL